MGKGQMYSWGKKGCHQGFEWSMNTWIFSYMGAKKYERNIKGNIKGIHEYSHMGAKKVPMAEKRTYPGSELTWRRNRETCQKEIMKNFFEEICIYFFSLGNCVKSYDFGNTLQATYAL